MKGLSASETPAAQQKKPTCCNIPLALGMITDLRFLPYCKHVFWGEFLS